MQRPWSCRIGATTRKLNARQVSTKEFSKYDIDPERTVDLPRFLFNPNLGLFFCTFNIISTLLGKGREKAFASKPLKTQKCRVGNGHFWKLLRIERGEDSRTTVMVRNVAGNNARKERLLRKVKIRGRRSLVIEELQVHSKNLMYEM